MNVYGVNKEHLIDYAKHQLFCRFESKGHTTVHRERFRTLINLSMVTFCQNVCLDEI